MRATILLISFLFSSVTLLGQEMYDEDYTLKDNQGSLKRIWKKAQREHKAKNYDNALGLYELLAERDSSNVKFLYEAASLADTLNAFVMAEYYYAKAVKHENRANHPTLDFQYAKVLQTLGHYDQAIRYYQRFREEQDRTGKVSNAQLYLASQLQDECKAAKRMVEESSSIYSNLKMLGDPVNSKNTSDFAPYQDNGELYFSRLQYTDQKRENRGLKIYKHRKEEKGYYKAVQTDDNNAYFSLSSDAQHLYEINCTDLNQEFGSRGCKIYRRDLVKGAWSRAKILPNTINLEGCVNTQPAIGTDSEGNDVLFFSSNRPGGEGKMDIWSSIILKDDDGYLSYEDPVNVGQVNSSADEISPYFHGKCNTLYFSSDRKPSIGGFDIYEATFNGRGYERINPLPYPINSSFDDVDFFRSGTGDKVFFASQRLPEEEIGGEEDVKGCCLDIYEANLEMPVDLDVLVYCGNAPVTEANYKMEAMLSKGAEMAIDTSGSLDAPIRLKPNEEYQFYISKAGYTTAKFPILTNDVCEPTQLSERVYIRPLKNLMIDVRKKVAGGDAPADSITLEIEEYEDGFKIDEVFSEKANIVKLAVEIEKKYRVYVKSPGYEEEIFEIEIPDVKKACLTEKTITLTPKIVDGLEIDVAIYFHDDIPARKFRTGTARDGAVDVSYKTTYDDYVNMRDEYKRELSDFYLNNGEFDAANQVGIEIDNFFNNQVEDGFDNLKLYADAVAKYFSKPNMPSISIVIQGSASPTARTPGGIKYNQYLSSRRINSVKNYLRSHSPILREKINSGAIEIEVEPMGENVDLEQEEIDKIRGNNGTFGVYAPLAAGTRKVTITKFRIQEE